MECLKKKECMTVVVPVYNRKELVVRCLDSIYAQTCRPLNVIVVDNGSSDGTVENVRRWASMRCDDSFGLEIICEPRRGAANARQRGLENTKTKYVMFFDSDDVMRNDSVEKILDTWKKNPEADIIAWPLTIHRGNSIRITHSIKGNLLERHLVHAIFCTLGYAVKTDFLNCVGGWDGSYLKWDDLEVGVRLMLGNPKVKGLNMPLADVYPQKESITGVNFSDSHGGWEKTLDGIEKIILKSKRDDTRRLLNIVAYRRAILAADYAKEGRMDLAKPLYSKALEDVAPAKRLFIRFAYEWTRRGMRGAFSIVGFFL